MFNEIGWLAMLLVCVFVLLVFVLLCLSLSKFWIKILDQFLAWINFLPA